jgi:hypothetical protein
MTRHGNITGREPKGVEMGERYCMPIVGCGHPAEWKWLTRKMVICACGTGLNRETFWEVATSVEVLRPKEHCNKWRPGDPEDRYHGRRCSAKGWSEQAWNHLDALGESPPAGRGEA